MKRSGAARTPHPAVPSSVASHDWFGPNSREVERFLQHLRRLTPSDWLAIGAAMREIDTESWLRAGRTARARAETLERTDAWDRAKPDARRISAVASDPSASHAAQSAVVAVVMRGGIDAAAFKVLNDAIRGKIPQWKILDPAGAKSLRRSRGASALDLDDGAGNAWNAERTTRGSERADFFREYGDDMGWEQ